MEQKRNWLLHFLIIKGPTLLTFSLVGYLSYVYNFRFIPNMVNYAHIIFVILVGLFFNTNLILTMWAYFKCMLSDPGFIHEQVKHIRNELYWKLLNDYNHNSSDIGNQRRVFQRNSHASNYNRNVQEFRWSTDIEAQGEDSREKNEHSNEESKVTGSYRPPVRNQMSRSDKKNHLNTVYKYCGQCDNIKPPRTHHCSLCQRCVRRMDHHCPWVGNWVGFNNHKFFILFLLYALNGCIFEAVSIILSIAFGVAPVDKDYGEVDIHHLVATVFSWALACALSILFLMHVTMIGKNQSTLELGAYKKNPFDKGSWYDNFKVIFGSDFKMWFLPFDPVDRGTDGMDYGISTEMINENSYQNRI